ncbi:MULTISPECIES: Lrp/AsnC family transcriptional regulator [Aeromonas]|jgi:Lrp/AsnC family leucine-responsive transcriptional regulator|uniref:Lrp/AsnC family transcriptional regulator n=1 Tax=Aeromonas media TaxID=651 RepID=A0AAP6GCA1_AERME|nr:MULTISPECIES: Lrp/AsnC family transcriptional regulator [Aeromonas]MCK2082485.1 Lrp/AsnC family transcriptional regulator [Aeromonas genomosp. paramedia]MDX7900831.1 Lrp/AsnC family transcriptional regulator [Aeromonas media]MDX7922682.1 Lrp/AsnC family transcriptional regulator [Aeromonas media]
MTDKFDLLILAELQQDARLPIPELAHRVGLSAPACYRRVRALREAGLIEREVALVAPATMGWPITMLVLVTLERDHGRIVDEMIASLQREPEVMDLWYVTGEQDFVLQVAARDMQSYEQFTRRVLHAREQVRSFKTLVVMGQHKRCGALLPG